MAVGRDLKKEKHKVVAVIGDGSLSGGLAFEGMNNLGIQSTDMILVLNDNEMSIARNVGALSRYLTRLITDRRYNRIKTEVWELLGNLSNVGKGIRNLVHSVDETLKHFVIPGKLFEDMGLRYFGPVDGHNIAEMAEVFKFVRDSTTGPVLVHVLTKKGKGYSYAEEDATKYHGISTFSPETGMVLKSSGSRTTYSMVFGNTLVSIAEKHDDVVAITAAMPDGTGLVGFRDRFPRRFFDVGIAEGHAATFAAGLALKGLKPVVAVYSTFLQRAYDQIMHDVALDGLHVVFCIDRAGLVGDDGPTHHGMFDLSYLRTVPNAVIMAPRNENELRNMVYTAVVHMNGPVFIRYPRGSGPGARAGGAFERAPLCKPDITHPGSGCALISAGGFYGQALEVREALGKQGMKPTLVDARFVKPLDREAYAALFRGHSHVVTFESNSLAGGFGSGVLELLDEVPLKKRPRLLRLGYPDSFVTHGGIEDLHKELGLDTPTMTKKILEFLRS
jgi:1-deoxy-D-xylulose-5-phosphate synthase